MIKTKKKTLLEKELSKISIEDLNLLKTVKKYGVNSMELNQILKTPPKEIKLNTVIHKHDILGRVKIGVIADTHIGVKEFDENLFARAAFTFKKEKVHAVYHCGDLLEGMSGRDGHIYELKYVGFSQQMKYAEKLFKKYFKGLKVYAITGNHDLWFKKKRNIGIDVGEEFQARLGKENFEYLGENEADVKIGPRTIMRLRHPADGTAYALSYKMQKLIESLESGKKPQILIQGHYHKCNYMFYRNVHGLDAGTLSGQTEWMRGKGISAHKGFWILDLDISKTGISRFAPNWYPSYD